MTVGKGEIYGFLGLNGAGKSTLIRILLGMINANKGQVKLFGKEVNAKFENWNKIGYLVETPHSYGNISVYDNLRLIHKLRRLSDINLIDRIIDDLKINRYKHIKAKQLSMGNKQRLGLAKALIHRPELLILDEPINGLDPAGIVEVRNLLLSLAQEGSTIFLSSHILEEIAKITDRIGIIHNGTLIKEINKEEMHSELEEKLLVKTQEQEKARNTLIEHGIDATPNEKGQLEVKEVNHIRNPGRIAELLVQAQLPPLELIPYKEDLEHYFLRQIKDI